MNPPHLASSRLRLLGGAAIIVLAACGFLAWRHWRLPVRTEDVEAFLDRKAGGGRVRFALTRMGTLRKGEADLELNVTATARVLWPLYSKIDASDYLRRTFGIKSEATAEARRLLAGGDLSKNPEYTGAGPFPADPYRAVILQLRSPADVSFGFQGIIGAHRDGGTWGYSLLSGGFEGDGPQGEARSSFGDPSYVAGDPRDDARLRALATDLESFAGRVAEARLNLESARATAIDGRRRAFLAQVAPGRVFRGLAVEAGEQRGTSLYLEISALSPGNEVTALLRNDSGWHNARTFQGAWSADNGFEVINLSLTSLPEQAVRNAGPFLEDTQTWVFTLRVDPQGGLSERNRLFQYQFHPLEPGQVSELKARLGAEYEGAVSATAPGAFYNGTAISRASEASEPILLRFTRRSEDGESFDAMIESTTRSWKRPLHGAMIANARRSGGEPIRLHSGSNEAVEDAPAGSVLGYRDDLDMRLGLEEGRLVGDDGQFTYSLSSVGEANLRKMAVDSAERARRFRGVLRDGIAYDGILREYQGFVALARLEVYRIDWRTGAISARIHSLARLNAYRDFLGTCDPSGGSVVLEATGRGEFGSDDNFDIPFLKAPVPATLHLELTGGSITGRIEGDTNWAMVFPTGVFLSAPTENPDPGSPAADGSVFPAFPRKAGAYLLTPGGWSPLPTNQGHVVVETVSEAAKQATPRNIAKEKDKSKVSYLQFDGKDPRPESGAPAIIILFVGPEPSGSPLVELAPAETIKDGQRRVEIAGDSPAKILFGERRLAAYVRQVASGSILLTTTSAPAPGPYVFRADVGYELTQR